MEKTAAFLKDFENWIRLTPGLDDASQRRAYLAQLAQYTQTLRKFQDVFERLVQKLKERSLSSNLRREHEQEVAAAAEAKHAEERRQAFAEAYRQKVAETEFRRLVTLSQEELYREAEQQVRQKLALVERAASVGRAYHAAWAFSEWNARRIAEQQQFLLAHYGPSHPDMARLAQERHRQDQALASYRCPRLIIEDQDTATLPPGPGLHVGQHCAFARPKVGFVGVLKIIEQAPSGEFRALAVRGRFVPGDFAVYTV